MKPELAMWINRAGLFLDFLAFWFAAPELLGEKRLRSVEAAVERSMNLLLGLISAITWGVTLLIFILPVFIAGRTLLVPALSGLLLTVNSFFMVYWGLRNNVFRDRKKNLAKDKSFIFFSIVTIGLLIFVVVWEINAKEKVWLVVVFGFRSPIYSLGDRPNNKTCFNHA